MKSYFRLVALVALSVAMTGCWTSILTVAPTPKPVAPVSTVYTTQVTTPAPKHTTTTTVTVTSFNDDWSFYLDLQAVAAAFAESRNVAEFEELLNSSRYMINNLDLNKDGFIDYLRVLESRKGAYHAFLIQACLAPSVFQDVATLFAEHRPGALYVEVIGDRYLYGPNYIVRPTFIKRPPMWDVFGRPTYTPWMSPYHYGYWPNYYQQPKPIYLTHYQAYVTTYIEHHHYFHVCDYPSQPYYSNYTYMVQPNCRHDYQTQHPDHSFDQRVTHQLSANGSGVTVRNAGDLRTATTRHQQEQATSQTSGRSSGSSTSGVSQRQATTTTASTKQPTTREQQTKTTQTTQTSGRSSGSSASGVSQRQATTTTASTKQPTTREQQTKTTQTTQTSGRSSSSSTSGVSQRQATSTTASTKQTTQRKPSTSVETRVSKSGTTRTTIKTTDANGKTTTVKRTTPRTSTTSSTTSTRTSGTSTRSSGTSTSTRSGGSTRR